MSTTSSRPGTTRLPNENLHHLDSDYLFHLDIPLNDPEVMSKFQDVKFVCIGGTAKRMEHLALHLAQELNHKNGHSSPFDFFFQNERYSGFKVGPVLCVSHGIGSPSMSVMLHEVFKLLQRAKTSDITLIRVGTCGGIGVTPGTVVVSTGSLTAGMEPVYITSSLGEPLRLPTTVDINLVNEICKCRRDDDGFQVKAGITYCADDFYQGQGRLDGSFCDYSKKEQDDFLRKLHDNGVCNIEMESACVLAMAHKVGIKAAVVCAVLVNRLESDLPQLSSNELKTVQGHAIELVVRYIRQKLDTKTFHLI